MRLMLTKKYNILGLVRSIMLNFFLVTSVWFCLILDILMLLQTKVRQHVPHPNTALTWPSYRIHFLSDTTILKSHSRKRLKNMLLALNATILLLFDLSCSLSFFSFLSNNKLSRPQHLVPVLRILGSIISQSAYITSWGNYKPTWISISSAEEEWDYIV